MPATMTITSTVPIADIITKETTPMLALGKLLELTLAGREPAEKTPVSYTHL